MLLSPLCFCILSSSYFSCLSQGLMPPYLIPGVSREPCPLMRTWVVMVSVKCNLAYPANTIICCPLVNYVYNWYSTCFIKPLDFCLCMCVRVCVFSFSAPNRLCLWAITTIVVWLASTGLWLARKALAYTTWSCRSLVVITAPPFLLDDER